MRAGGFLRLGLACSSVNAVRFVSGMSGNANSRVPAAPVEVGGMELLHTIFAVVSNNELHLDTTQSHFSPQRAGIRLSLYFTNWTCFAKFVVHAV